jgi:hypothetical protein
MRLAGLLSAAAIAAALAPDAVAASDCGPPEARQVLRTSRIVVTRARVDEGPDPEWRHYACARGAKRAHVLDDPTAEDDEFGEFWSSAYLFRTNRNYLAYAREYGNDTHDYIKAEVVVLNISTGRRRVDNALDSEDRYTSFNWISDLVVSSGGIAAWIAVEGFRNETPNEPWEVQRAKRGKLTPLGLDAGPHVEPRSLVLAAGGARVAWRNGSSRRSARLR